MLKATPRNEGAAVPGIGKRGNKMVPRYDDAPTLAELGLDKRTASVAQKLAELPDAAFNQDRSPAQIGRDALGNATESRCCRTGCRETR